jgi:hypothetical protein
MVLWEVLEQASTILKVFTGTLHCIVSILCSDTFDVRNLFCNNLQTAEAKGKAILVTGRGGP